jgi:hypothetical protein
MNVFLTNLFLTLFLTMFYLQSDGIRLFVDDHLHPHSICLGEAETEELAIRVWQERPSGSIPTESATTPTSGNT